MSEEESKRMAEAWRIRKAREERLEPGCKPITDSTDAVRLSHLHPFKETIWRG